MQIVGTTGDNTWGIKVENLNERTTPNHQSIGIGSFRDKKRKCSMGSIII